MLETLRSNWKVIAAGAFAPLASFAMFHMVTVFPLSWVFLFTDETPARFLAIEAVAAVVGVLAIIASGRLADLQPDVSSEEHTSALQSLMRISYAVFCMKIKKHNTTRIIKQQV